MKSLAAFAMRGRLQAMSLACLLAVSALLVSANIALALVLGPLLTVASSAIIGLTTLRHGPLEGGLVMLAGLLAMGVVSLLVFGGALGPALSSAVIVLWLPLWLLGILLRGTRALNLAVEAAVVGAALLVLAQYVVFDDPAAFWTGLLSETVGKVLAEAGQQAQQFNEIVDDLGVAMVGELGRAWFFQVVLALFLARGWQAALYNPGGFREEFHGLKLGRWLLIATPVLLIAATVLGSDARLAGYLALMGMSALMVQGVAVVHVLIAARGKGRGWLIAFYVFLLLGMQAMFPVVSVLGFADGLMDLRGRVRAAAKAPDDDGRQD